MLSNSTAAEATRTTLNNFVGLLKGPGLEALPTFAVDFAFKVGLSFLGFFMFISLLKFISINFNKSSSCLVLIYNGAMHKRSSFLLVLGLIVTFFSLSFPAVTSAVPSQVSEQTPSGVISGGGCGQSNAPSFQALIGAKKDTYVVYVRLARSGQNASSSIYFQSFQGGSCQLIGTTLARGDGWQPVGTWSVNGPAEAGNFVLQSGAIDSAPSANRPTIMLVSKTKPACQPTVECYVNLDGQTGIVRPTGTLLNEDTLHVVTAIDPADDQLQKVTYYVDDRSVYTTTSLEPFNTHYVGLGAHTLTRVATYASGQSIVFSSTYDNGYDNPAVLFVSILYGQNTAFKIMLIIFVIACAWLLFRGILRAIHKRRVWKKTHILKPAGKTPRPSAKPAATEAAHFTKPDSTLKLAAQWTTVILSVAAAVILLVAVLYNFVIQIYQVDGPSMQTTLHTGQHLLVNRLGRTWARVDRKKYVPKRGSIVVFNKQQASQLSLDVSQEQSYVVKRIIGLPGERVTLNAGKFHVYNAQFPQGFDPDANHSWSSNIQAAPSYESVDITLGPDEVFVSGDNRPDSVDSRSYGAVKVDNLIGQVVLRISPQFKIF